MCCSCHKRGSTTQRWIVARRSTNLGGAVEYRVTLIKGDGIGPEVTGATCRILNAAGAPIEWEEAPGGLEAVDQYGHPMPEATLNSVRKNRLGLKGPLATPKGKGYRSANVHLRQELDLYVGYRPVRTLPGISTPYTFAISICGC